MIRAFLMERKIHLSILTSYFLAAFFVSFENGIPLNPVNVILGLFSMYLMFFFIYAYNSFVDVSSEKKYKKHNMFMNNYVSSFRIYVCFFIFFILSLGLSYFISVYHLFLIVVIGIIGFFYSSKLMRLKEDGAYVKSLAIVFSSILAFVYFFLLFSQDILRMTIFALYFGSLSLCGTIFQDIKDRVSDTSNNIKTFAVLYSDKEIASRFNMMTFFIYSFFVIMIVLGNIAPIYLLILLVIPLRVRFTSYIKEGNYLIAAKVSLYSYIFSVLILFIIWLLKVI